MCAPESCGAARLPSLCSTPACAPAPPSHDNVIFHVPPSRRRPQGSVWRAAARLGSRFSARDHINSAFLDGCDLRPKQPSAPHTDHLPLRSLPHTPHARRQSASRNRPQGGDRSSGSSITTPPSPPVWMAEQQQHPAAVKPPAMRNMTAPQRACIAEATTPPGGFRPDANYPATFWGMLLASCGGG